MHERIFSCFLFVRQEKETKHTVNEKYSHSAPYCAVLAPDRSIHLLLVRQQDPAAAAADGLVRTLNTD